MCVSRLVAVRQFTRFAEFHIFFCLHVPYRTRSSGRSTFREYNFNNNFSSVVAFTFSNGSWCRWPKNGKSFHRKDSRKIDCNRVRNAHRKLMEDLQNKNCTSAFHSRRECARKRVSIVHTAHCTQPSPSPVDCGKYERRSWSHSGQMGIWKKKKMEIETSHKMAHRKIDERDLSVLRLRAKCKIFQNLWSMRCHYYRSFFRSNARQNGHHLRTNRFVPSHPLSVDIGFRLHT